MNTENKLPKAFKKKFVAALRSGKYKQGTGFLFDPDNGYCCLGVACVVAGAVPRAIGMILPGYGIKGISKVPKILIGKMISSGKRDVPSILAGMNDSGKTFSEIADYIEKNL